MGARRLFHTIVVVGAAVGCGSSSPTSLPNLPPEELPPRAVPSAAPSSGPLACSSPEQYQCDDAGVCRCDPAAPTSPCGCARPGEFRCKECLSGPAVLGFCPNNDGVGCFCNTSIAIAAPTDCANPAQFSCSPPPANTSQGTFVGFSSDIQFAQCTCDATRPTSAGDCAPPSRFICSGSTGCTFTAPASATSDVPFDCSCVPPVIPIAA